MAKLGTYYGLCPLVESKSLIGISEDEEKGIVVATLSKNIAGRYKLSDQKQICCWKTKEKFSCPVIYDQKIAKYVAVFNRSYIKLWNSDEENLDKLKKYKFIQPVHSVFTINNETFILFENGNLFPLVTALELRKELEPEAIISVTEGIDDVLYIIVNNLLYIGLIVRYGNEYFLYWTTYSSTIHTYTKIKLHRESCNLRGCGFHPVENVAHLLTLWSDGKIFSWSLEEIEETLFPGELFTVMQHISTKYTVSMLSLNQNYMAMLGANKNEEGALLLIYNTQFKVTQTKQSFKLFSNGAKLWSYENNLLLPVGQNLAVIPFYLENEQLAALLGSHKVVECEMDADISIIEKFEIASWDQKLKLKDLQTDEQLKRKINNLLKQGLPESLITEELLTVILKNQDINTLSLFIDCFLDIPEKYVAKLLKHIIMLDKRKNRQSDSVSKLSTNVQPISRIELLDKILSKSFNDMLILPYFHLELTLTETIALLNYIYCIWSEEGHLLPSMNVVKSHAKLIQWIFVIIDTSYQKLLISKDECTKTLLNKLNNIVEEHLHSLDELKFLSSVLDYIKARKSCINGIGRSNMTYCIEQTSFY